MDEIRPLTLQLRIIPVLDSIKELLQSKNLKASSARMLLLEKLRKPQGHFSAEDLFQQLRETLNLKAVAYANAHQIHFSEKG